MPRIPRGEISGYAYHVLNRGNGRAMVFHKDRDYDAFIHLLALAKHRFPIEIHAFSLLPNHFHVMLRPTEDSALSPFMQWWFTAHVRRYHRHYQTSGHVWQGRFKSFPIQQDEHFLAVVSYVLRNPVRAGLARHPIDWPWSSLHFPQLTDPWPVPEPPDLAQRLTEPLSEADLAAVRHSVNRQAPFGLPK